MTVRYISSIYEYQQLGLDSTRGIVSMSFQINLKRELHFSNSDTDSMIKFIYVVINEEVRSK